MPGHRPHSSALSCSHCPATVTLKKFFLTSIYLLGCASSWLQHEGSLLFLRHADSLAGAWRIRFHDQGSNPGPLHWERGVLATGSPGTPPSPLLSTAPLGRAFRPFPSRARDWWGLSLLRAYLVPAPAPVLFLLPETLPQSLVFFHEVFLFCRSRAGCLEKCL